MLELEAVNSYYGTAYIIKDLCMKVFEKEVVCLLGRNGAGKTTTLKSIIGLIRPRSGSIKFRGKELSGMAPEKIARMGIGFVPEDRIIFPDLTVAENLKIAIKASPDSYKQWTENDIYELFPVLRKLSKRLGGYLSGGEQQMLTVGRTLMGNPSLLLLDEPIEGLAPLVVKELGTQILRLKESQLTILLAEQNIRFATSISNRAYVIDKGLIRFNGSIEELAKSEEIYAKHLMF